MPRPIRRRPPRPGCRPPGGSYVPVNATVFDTYTEDLGCGNPGGADERTRYQAFADVTSLVQAGGGGSYTIANVQAGTGADRHAGWSLVVAYQDISQPARNLTIFDGFAQVALGADDDDPRERLHDAARRAPSTRSSASSPTRATSTSTGDALALNGATLADARALARQLLQLGHLEPRRAGDGQVARLRQSARLRRGRARGAAGRRGQRRHQRDHPAVHHERPLPARRRLLPHRHLRPGDGAAQDRHRPQRRRRQPRRRPALRDQLDQHRAQQRLRLAHRRRDPAAHERTGPARSRSSTSPGGIAGVKTRSHRRRPGRVRRRRQRGALPDRHRCRSARAPERRRRRDRARASRSRCASTSSSAAGTADGTQILNTAILSSKDADGIDYTSIASAPAAVTVRGVPDVTIDKSHTGTFVRGRQGTFTLLVSNVGGRATTGAVVIDDTLPRRTRNRQRRRHRLVVLGRRRGELAALRALRRARAGRGVSRR